MISEPEIIHQSTVNQLSEIERFFLNLFVKDGKYKIVEDVPPCHQRCIEPV